MAVIVGTLLLVVVGTSGGFIELFVRIFRPNFDAHLPSFSFMLGLFVFAGLVCVAMVGWFTRPHNGPTGGSSSDS